MKIQPLALLVSAALAGVVSAQPAAPTLTPADGRIHDAAISADQQTFESMQARLKALNDAGRPLRDRHLAKAQCWLDTSFHEYTRNDRGPWPQAALEQADALARALAAGQTPGDDTPLVAGAQRLRPDLWARTLALRTHAGWACAQARAACAEVELVHSGHEEAQLGWRHARPYVQLAEDMVGEAEAQAQACAPAAARPASTTTDASPRPPLVAVPPKTPDMPAARGDATPPAVTVLPSANPAEVILFAQVVFRFDGDRVADVPAGGLVSVQALLQKLREDRLVLQQVDLAGHADRLVASRKPDYNLQLSQQRVNAVRELLVQGGIAADRIRTQALGDSQPREQCDRFKTGDPRLVACLLPNRRVEITVTTRRP